MSRREFEQPFTCPQIDTNISIIQDSLKENIEALLSDKDSEQDYGFIDSWVDHFYMCLEDSIENIRTTNEDIRDAAEDQIRDLMDELEETKDQLKWFEDENENLKNMLEDVEYEKSELQDKIYDLEEEIKELENSVI